MWQAKENDFRTYSVQQIVFHIERNANLRTAPLEMKRPDSSCSRASSRMHVPIQLSKARFVRQKLRIKCLNNF